ncbi:MAG: tetratricopeptide repeat protein [Bryobacteraceae bacterium]
MRAVLILVCASAAAAQTIERAEQLWRAKNYVSANDAFRALCEKNPKNADYRVRWGRLLLERFNKADAAELFREALEVQKDHAGALYGLALVMAEDFDSKAVELAEKALAADPKMYPARELLARLALEDNQFKKAAEEADKALALSPDALDAMAIHAVIDWLSGKTETPWIGRVLEKNPKYGEAYATAGHFFVLNRRYEEGIAFYRKAIEIAPELWPARSQLGVNLMRLGEEVEARKHLELCYENSHRDPATVNTLRLMDSYKNFVTFKTDTTILRLHKKEAALLRPYFESELERAMRTFEKKYKVKLTRPVQLEVYPDHEDFAVRTMGMPGLGALGVTFGYVVAMDSPSGRPPGKFHWATTLWHELSHVFVLSATRHRVPRWFTEGMAVHEETAVSTDWGDRLDPQVISALKKKLLLPVADLDRGFVRPTYPSQVIVSYFQAGRICDYIAKHWSYQRLLDMMHSYAGGASTPEAIEKHLGMKPEEFDKKFLAELEAETKKVVDGFDEWSKRRRAVAEAAKAKKHDEVIKEGLAIRDIYPDFVETGSVYEFLANAYLETNNKPRAIEELATYSKTGGRDPGLLKKLATLLEEAGRKKEAAATLERINYVYPVDEELHRRLAGLWLEAGNREGAIREAGAVVAMNPIDAAGAHYNLARAYRAAGRVAEARDAVVSSLEAAPGYRPAQKLLLELSQGENAK